MPAPTDQELMQEIARGRPERLALLFERHHRRLYAFFMKLGLGRPASEDLVQESFIRMLRYAASYRDEGNFMAWMYRLARNAAADAHKAGKHEVLMDGEGFDALPASASSDPDSQHGLLETERRLQRALLRLPREKRELILLSRVRQLGSEDLARLFGCSVPALKVRLHRSLEELRRLYADTGQPSSGSQRENCHEL